MYIFKNARQFQRITMIEFVNMLFNLKFEFTQSNKIHAQSRIT